MLSPGQFLKEIIRLKILKNPSLSIRSVARATGVSGAYLSRVMAGKSTISIKRATTIAEKLKFSRIEKSAFLQSVAVYSARGEARQTLIKALEDAGNHVSPFVSTQYDHLEDDAQGGLLSRWFLPALLDLVTCTNFRPEIGAIAARLELSEPDVLWGIEKLESLGLLDRSSPRWQKKQNALYCAGAETKQTVRDFHSQMSQKVIEVLGKSPDRKEFERRSITGITMAIDPAHLATAKKMIERFQHKLANHLTLGSCTEVYQLNVQLFALTKEATDS